MGAVGSSIYGHCRRLLIRYNAENRAHKFLDKGQLPRAPRHKLSEKLTKEIPLSREILEEIHCKNEQLQEYLKKVYLTSTTEITGTPSKTHRPKPKKENEVFKTKMFYEPPKATPGHCTLTNVIQILLKFQNDPNKYNTNAICTEFNLDKKDATNLLMFYSLFTLEKFDFINTAQETEEAEKIKFETFTETEKKPLRRLESK